MKYRTKGLRKRTVTLNVKIIWLQWHYNNYDSRLLKKKSTIVRQAWNNVTTCLNWNDKVGKGKMKKELKHMENIQLAK